MKTVALLLFPDVEVLDFAGPFEVFSVAGEVRQPAPFRVITVADSANPIAAVGGLNVAPHFDLATAPQADVLIIPGGKGSRAAMRDPRILDWVARQAARAEVVASVCTGALILGKLGLLDGLAATTHAGAIGELRAISDKIDVRPTARFIDNGKYLTSGGITAGIDMSLYLLKRLTDQQLVDLVVEEMEYDWRMRAAG
ncbi:DJ-1/PfpI family protein [Dongia rigui]|uniref:DJ-1/PfpI family protein n=1 Tax=Dongia rigui TaxID=940149 RepID=A0ABU5DXL4_9PROT|nr:DJ-1/PfpI family protein [Dongia rigui]MDY0872048.1 DJ-1/PfpI family protein [Dongia rigui]